MKKLVTTIAVLFSSLIMFSQTFQPIMDSVVCVEDSILKSASPDIVAINDSAKVHNFDTTAVVWSLMLKKNTEDFSKRISLTQKVYGFQNKKDKRLFLLTNSCFFLSGAVRGLNETIIYDYATFDKHFPGANEMWWNPMKSYKNSYPNGLLFQTMLIAPKDAKHTLDFFQNNLLYVCIPIQLFDIHELRKLSKRQLVARWITPIALHSLGFELVHKGFFGL
jgi:hypothetical protein